jgi:hypothetical protein
LRTKLPVVVRRHVCTKQPKQNLSCNSGDSY